jgi:hypothetical protein
MRMGPVSFSALFAFAPLVLSAQRSASLGASTGMVRYPGGSSFSPLALSPTAQQFSTWSYIGLGGSVSLLDDGEWAAQGRADFWSVIARRSKQTQLALSASAAASTRTDGLGAGSALALLEVVRGKGAAGAGAVTGLIEGLPGVTALRLRARGWWQPRDPPAQVSLTVEGNRFLGAWYTDIIGGVNVDRGGDRIVASLWVSGRLSTTYGSSAAGSATIQYYLTPTLALEASGGSYLADPYQGLPRAGFFAAGIRLFTARRALKTQPPASSQPVLQPLIAQHRGDTLVVRFRMPGARSVAIAGNWNAWTPAPLRQLGDDIWEAPLQLAPGVYYFNLVVDGNDWVVPGGVATVPDGMGGVMAVLNVL